MFVWNTERSHPKRAKYLLCCLTGDNHLLRISQALVKLQERLQLEGWFFLAQRQMRIKGAQGKNICYLRQALVKIQKRQMAIKRVRGKRHG